MQTPEEKYFDLLAKALTGALYPESAWQKIDRPRGIINRFFARMLVWRGYVILKSGVFDAEKRERGGDWPMIGCTMVGRKRLDNIRALVTSVVEQGIPGDFVECGVWRGGASIYAKATLDSLGSNRTVWCCDSFEGMPAMKAEDAPDPSITGVEFLMVPAEDVRANFARFGYLDERVKFVKGWFSESLPKAPIETISVLRLDGDYYSSTMDILTNLYHKVSRGGFVIVDDYHVFQGCRKAITEFRAANGITADILPIDGEGVYWRV